MGKIHLRIKEDSRFTEEIVKLYNGNDKSDVNSYDLAFSALQGCSVSERSPGVNGSNICQSCYYRDFSKKMEDVRKSKRREFIEYQLSIRENKLKWLDEFKDILTDYESQFDRFDYSLAREYRDLIDEIKQELAGNEEPETDLSSKMFGDLQELISEKIASSHIDALPSDISDSSERFRKDHPEESATAFLIMQFTETDVHNDIINTIKEILAKHDIIALRADDKEYSDDLFSNIKTYMHCCDFGIAIFERITEDDFNPNVSLEVGYMMGLNKPVCLLKDKSLKNLQTDLAGKLYKPLNLFKIKDSISKSLNKWLIDREIV